jgi:threonine/homoserine/homoserine lactone efflux protein
VPDLSTLAVFSLAALALLVVPGPAVLYIVARSVTHGRLAGIVSMLGVATGGLVHAVAAALGLSSLLVSSATAFTAVKYAGAVYLVVLGLRTLRSRPAAAGAAVPAEPVPLRLLYLQGVVVNVLNPKTALFFLALLPQFVDVHAGSAALQMIFLGVVFVALGVVSDGAYALAAGSVGAWARRRPLAVRAQRWVSGGVLVGLGVATALGDSGRRK